MWKQVEAAIPEPAQGAGITPALTAAPFPLLAREYNHPDPVTIRALARSDDTDPSVSVRVHVPEYQDQLIDPEGPAEDPLLNWSSAYRKDVQTSHLSPGHLGLEYRYFYNALDGDIENRYREQGIAATLRQASVDWGHLEVVVAGNHENTSFSQERETGGYGRIQQSDFFVTDTLKLDNRLGHIRPSASRLLSVSPRQRLPQPVVAGAQTSLGSESFSVSLAGGELGTLAGRTFPVFDNESREGEVAGLAAQYRFNSSFEAGVQSWKMQDVMVGAEISEHSSTVGAAAYQYRPWNLGTELHVLANNDGANGIWADGSWRQSSGLGHQFGVYKYDADLKWIDNNNQISNDRQGMYWEGQFTRSQLGLHMGADAYRTNLEDDLLFTTHRYTNLYSSAHYRMFRDTVIGGGIAWLGDRSEKGDFDANQDTWRLTTHASQKFLLGTSSARLSWSDSSGDLPRRNSTSAIYDHDWNLGSPLRLRTGVEYFLEQRETDDDREQTSLRTFASYPFQTVDASAGFSLGVGGSGATESGRSSSAFARLGWQISSAFQASLEYTYNKYNTRLLNNQEVLISEQTANLSIKYLADWGQPRRILGTKRTGGAGRILGKVFLDKNQNGLKEADEPGVPGVTVFLDRVYTTETDADGGFEFWPVGAGEHSISLDVSNVPLPWILEDESPRKIQVQTRKDSNIGFGLVSPGSPVAGFEKYGVN